MRARRASAAEAMLAEMGLSTTLYTGLLTSARRCTWPCATAPIRGSPPWAAGCGISARTANRNVMHGLDLEPVGTPDEAEFVLNTGPDDHRGPQDVAAFEDVLAACARRHLPMICANPDLEVIRGGVRVICAGALAARYEQLGGTVRSLGQAPTPAIYRPVLAMLGTTKARTLAVGDSPADRYRRRPGSRDRVLLGARRHPRAKHLAATHGAAAAEAQSAGLHPAAIIPRFVW